MNDSKLNTTDDFSSFYYSIKISQERIQTVQYLLNQREINEKLIIEKQSLIKQNEILSKNLCREQDNNLRNKKQSQEEIDLLKNQLQTIQQQFENLTNEHLKAIEQINHDKQEYQDEIQRLKRDFGLELYRKQDAEKKARAFEEKFHYEQTQNQKIQYDYTKIKHDLKTLQVKYDALQLEMIEIHENTKIKPIQIIPMLDDRTSTTTTTNEEQQPVIESLKRRTNDEVIHKLFYLLITLSCRIIMNK